MVLNFVWLPHIDSGIIYSMLYNDVNIKFPDGTTQEQKEMIIEWRTARMITSYVRKAIERTKEQVSEHWNTTLDNRTQGDSLGSFYNMTSEELEDALLKCNFSMYQHDSITSGCEGFITYDLLGHTGLVELKQFSPNFLVKLENNKANFLSCVIQIDKLDELELSPKEPTVLILGKHNDEKVVFTFHAGEPVTPSRILGEDKFTTVKEAISMGFDYAKVRRLSEEE